jgi:nicotinate dehydrogenase subunit A
LSVSRTASVATMATDQTTFALAAQAGAAAVRRRAHVSVSFSGWSNARRSDRQRDCLKPGPRCHSIGCMSIIALKVNGQSQTVDVDPATPLLYVLSDDLALRGPKFGCGLGQCGACTVIAGGRAIRSCVTPVSAMAGVEVTTLEGLGTVERPHPIQKAFIEEQASQCGFCLSGVILTAKAFLDGNPKASEAQIRQAMSGVLCRCFGHNRMLRAITRYSQGA